MVVRFGAILDPSLYTIHQCRRPAVLMEFLELFTATVLNKALKASVNDNSRYLIFNVYSFVEQDFGPMTFHNGQRCNAIVKKVLWLS